MKLVDLIPLNENGAFGMTSKELADTYSLKMLQQMRDEVMMDMENDPSVEPEGGSQADYYGGTLNGLDKAIAIKKGETKDVPYDVAIGRMTQDEYDKMMSTVKPDRASFEKSSKFDNIKENNNMRKVIRKIIKEQNFDDRLKSMMGADDFEKATNPKLAKLINNAIMSIDPNMSYKDFAKGVAQVLIDEYGVQNYEPFISELKKELDSTLG
tara:strand:+ start:814 stop:1446 length:633 start_codon:yes stop_codon:yes gene_type:complete